ncbi:MAG TPA: hypothetical protein VGM20_12595 [Gemmatimonadales bacterium]
MRAAYAISLAAAAVATMAMAGPKILPSSSVRFANRLGMSHIATLSANNKVLFESVAAGSQTDFATVTDTMVTFSLKIEGDTATATRTQSLAGDTRYTVTATMGAGNQPTLSVDREQAKDHQQ